MKVHRSIARAAYSNWHIERLESRYLLSSGALNVAFQMVGTSVHQSQAFSAKVTVSNSGSQTISAVEPELTQSAGQLTQARFYSPADASIAPGKSVVFIFSLLELVVGTFTISADATTPFGTSTGAQTATITVLPKTVGTTALTDSSGDAYLKVGRSTVPVQIVDKSTGTGISGLAVAVSGANRQDSRAVLVIADSQNRYPLQMAVLQGASAGATVRANVVRPFVGASSPAPTSVSIASGAGTALSAAVGAIETDFLPAPSTADAPTGVTAAFTAALKALATSKLPLPLPFAGSGAPKTLYSSGPIHVSETGTRLAQVVTEFAATGTVGEVIMGGLELATAGEISLPLAAVMLTSDFTFAATSNYLFEDGDASDVNISVESVGGFPFIVVTPVLTHGDSSFTFAPPDPVAEVTIDPTNASGQPIPGGSYELISKDDLGESIVGVLDSNGSADVPVELGNYDVSVSDPGSQTYTNSSVSIPSGGTSVDPTLAADPIVSGTLSTPLGQPTGILAPGTQYTLTPHFYDAAGNEVSPPGPVIYQVHNPPGVDVADVDPNTGVVTMGPGFGAALVTAYCNGVTTTATLTSTNGDGKYPAAPATPFTLSPTTLHFTTQQGVNPASQSFSVVGLSSKFTNFHYTDKNGWLTVASANVANYNVFNVSVDVSGLNPGTYSLPINVSDDTTGYHQSVIVTLTITEAPTPTLAASYTGNWTYPVFGFGDDYAQLTWYIHQSGNKITGSYSSTILDGSVDTPGEVNTDTFTGTIEGDSIILNNTGGSSFFATITGNTITGTSNYLQATSSYTLTAQ